MLAFSELAIVLVYYTQLFITDRTHKTISLILSTVVRLPCNIAFVYACYAGRARLAIITACVSYFALLVELGWVENPKSLQTWQTLRWFVLCRASVLNYLLDVTPYAKGYEPTYVSNFMHYVTIAVNVLSIVVLVVGLLTLRVWQSAWGCYPPDVPFEYGYCPEYTGNIDNYACSVLYENHLHAPASCSLATEPAYTYATLPVFAHGVVLVLVGTLALYVCKSFWILDVYRESYVQGVLQSETSLGINHMF